MSVRFAAEKIPRDPAFEPSPVLWEWPLEKGNIVGYACGLRDGHGSLDRFEPSENERAFVRNTVRHLASGMKEVQVGVLW